MPTAHAIYLVKSYANEQYAKNFIEEGEMYMNTATFYRYLAYREKGCPYNIDWTQDTSKGISDQREGIVCDSIFLRQNNPMFCMYTVADCDIKGERIIGLKRKAVNEFLANGHTCFVIVPIDEFFNVAISKLNNTCQFDFVHYEKASFESDFQYLISNDLSVLYRKSLRYAHQQEYRIVSSITTKQARIEFDQGKYVIKFEDGTDYRGVTEYIGDISKFARLFKYSDLIDFDKEYYTINL